MIFNRKVLSFVKQYLNGKIVKAYKKEIERGKRNIQSQLLSHVGILTMLSFQVNSRSDTNKNFFINTVAFVIKKLGIHYVLFINYGFVFITKADVTFRTWYMYFF